MKKMGMQDNTLCDIMAQVKLITAKKDSTYPSMEETSLAEDLAKVSRKMKIMRKSDDSLLDKDDITAQISTARPVGFKSKRVLQGECCCQEHCNLAMHFSAIEVREVEEA